MSQRYDIYTFGKEGDHILIVEREKVKPDCEAVHEYAPTVVFEEDDAIPSIEAAEEVVAAEDITESVDRDKLNKSVDVEGEIAKPCILGEEQIADKERTLAICPSANLASWSELTESPGRNERGIGVPLPAALVTAAIDARNEENRRPNPTSMRYDHTLMMLIWWLLLRLQVPFIYLDLTRPLCGLMLR